MKAELRSILTDHADAFDEGISEVVDDFDKKLSNYNSILMKIYFINQLMDGRTVKDKEETIDEYDNKIAEAQNAIDGVINIFRKIETTVEASIKRTQADRGRMQSAVDPYHNTSTH